MFLNHLEIAYQLLPLLLTVIVTLLAMVVIKSQKRLKGQARQINLLNEELNALLSCSRGISERLHDYQYQFRNITERQDKMEISEAGSVGYKQAVALFNRGATEDEMLSTCDLSRGEINLITHLQKSKSQNAKSRH